jgi:hypothetical protein
MDITGIAAAASSLAQTNTTNAVQMAVLKKALDIESQSAMQLIEAAAQVVYNNPPNLGNNIDVLA